MSDQVKKNEARDEAQEMEILDEAENLEDSDLDDVSGGGCNFCGSGCSDA